MTEPLQVGQFAIVDHEPVDRGPNAGIFEGKGPIEERAELFVLAEGTTPASEAFAGHVVTAIGTAWGGFDMSLSGCLTSAFREAERNIWDWNRKSIAQHQVSIGLTCFAHRGSQAIVAQAGPSAAFHFHEGELHVYFPRGEKARAIGSGAPPEPHLTRVDMHPGDRMLLLSTAGVDELDPEIIAGILALPGQQALQDLYQRLRGQRHVTALLIAAPDFPEEQSSPPPQQTAPSAAPVPDADGPVIDATGRSGGRGFQPSLFIDDEHEADVEAAKRALVNISTRASSRSAPHAPLAEHHSIQPLRRAVGESDNIRDLADRIRARSEAVNRTPVGAERSSPVASPPRPVWNNTVERPPGQPVSHLETAPPTRVTTAPKDARSRSFQRGLVGEAPPSSHNVASYAAAPPVGELAAERTRRLQATTSTAGASSSVVASGGAPLVRPRNNMGGRWKGNGSLSSRRTISGGGWSNDRTLVIGALAVLLIILLFFVGPRLTGSGGASQAELFMGAQQHFSLAQSTADPSAQRAALAQAEALLLQAHDSYGKTVESEQLFNQVAGAIRVLDNVLVPTAVETVADLSQYGEKPVTPSDMAVGGGYVFLLDTASSQIIAQPTGGTDATVIYKADEVLGHDHPMSIAMLTDGLLVLDASSQFWLAFPGYEATPVVINAPQNMSATDITVLNDSLYVLDAPAAAVYRFGRTTNGFEGEPEVYFAAPTLKDAVRLHIDQDVVTMAADGTISRYAGGTVLNLSQAGIDEPVATAQPVFGFDDGSSLILADPKDDRVVVIRRDGTFDRQYQHDAFAALTAFTLDDSNGYVFSGGVVRKITW